MPVTTASKTIQSAIRESWKIKVGGEANVQQLWRANRALRKPILVPLVLRSGIIRLRPVSFVTKVACDCLRYGGQLASSM